MKASPSFQFYPSDWLNGTASMSNTLKGIYIDLLCLQWVNGGPLLLDDVPRLLRIRREQWNIFLPEICQKFTIFPPFFCNEKMEEIRQKNVAYRQKQAQNAKKRQPSHQPNVSQTVPNGQPNDQSSFFTLQEDQTQDQDQSAARTSDFQNPKALYLIAREVVHDVPPDEAFEELKLRAAKARLAYDAPLITKAIASARNRLNGKKSPH